jgi:hypothetical protein
MDMSIFLAKVISLYFIIISISMWHNGADFFKEVIQDIANNAALRLLGGVISLILGILLIVSYNYWIFEWTIIITLFAWMVFIKGFVITVFPKWGMEINRKFVENKNVYNSSIVIMLLLGIYLGWHGFFLS